MEKVRKAIGHGILSLWINWVIGVGSLMLVVFLSPIMSKLWLPLVVFSLELLLFALIRRNRAARVPVCYLVPFVVTRSLFWSATIMVVINMLHVWFGDDVFDPDLINMEIPFISTLIVFPVTFVMAALASWRGTKLGFCVECRMRHGTVAERGFLGNLFSQEGPYQVRMLFWLSGLLTIVGWLYYSIFYVNVNLNASDNFFFVWMPVILLLLSFLYLGTRYVSLWIYYCQNIEGSVVRQGSSTMLRYIIMCDDYMFLKVPDRNKDLNPDETRVDTPVHIHIPYKAGMSEYDAEFYFKGYTNIKESTIRFMYLNSNFDTEYNIYHYASIVEDRAVVDNSRLEGEWFTMPQIERMIKENELSAVLSAEINRLYTMIMAWKTYDRSGRRLYNIKNYKPTFRLRDFKNWDLDLNDPVWLFVSVNNEDRPFYHIRRFWRKHVNGIGE